VKAEVEKSRPARQAEGESAGAGEDVEMGEDINATGEGKGRNEWLEVAIDVPGLRDDDALPVFLGAMLSEALCADGGLRDRLWINARFHWRLYVDVSCCNSTFVLIWEDQGHYADDIDYRFCSCRRLFHTLCLC
jgi:exosome complex component RRP42